MAKNLRVQRRFFDETRHGVERLVRMENQHVAVANRAPQVRYPVERRHRQRYLRPVLEARHIHRGIELKQVGKGGEAFAWIKIFRRQLELVDQLIDYLVGQVRVVLQAH